MDAQEKIKFVKNTHLCDLIKLIYETKCFKSKKLHEISGYVSSMNYRGVGISSKNPVSDRPSIFNNTPDFVNYDKIRNTSRLYENPVIDRDEL